MDEDSPAGAGGPRRQALFHVGQIVRHRLFDYRGVIFDVDPIFSLTEGWYESMARTRPPKDRPWYHVLVDGASHHTYVAERNLEASVDTRPIEHPDLDRIFDGYRDGAYVPAHRHN